MAKPVPGDPAIDADLQEFLKSIQAHDKFNVLKNAGRAALRDLACAAKKFAADCDRAVDWRSEQALGGHSGATEHECCRG